MLRTIKAVSIGKWSEYEETRFFPPGDRHPSYLQAESQWTNLAKCPACETLLAWNRPAADLEYLLFCQACKEPFHAQQCKGCGRTQLDANDLPIFPACRNCKHPSSPKNPEPAFTASAPNMASRWRGLAGLSFVAALGIAGWLRWKLHDTVTASEVSRAAVIYLQSLTDNPEALAAATFLHEKKVAIDFVDEIMKHPSGGEEPDAFFSPSNQVISVRPSAINCSFVSANRIRCREPISSAIPHLARSLVHESLHAQIFFDLGCTFSNTEDEYLAYATQHLFARNRTIARQSPWVDAITGALSPQGICQPWWNCPVEPGSVSPERLDAVLADPITARSFVEWSEVKVMSSGWNGFDTRLRTLLSQPIYSRKPSIQADAISVLKQIDEAEEAAATLNARKGEMDAAQMRFLKEGLKVMRLSRKCWDNPEGLNKARSYFARRQEDIRKQYNAAMRKR